MQSPTCILFFVALNSLAFMRPVPSSNSMFCMLFCCPCVIMFITTPSMFTLGIVVLSILMPACSVSSPGM